ncbi:MAG: DUF1175 family protein [Pyrinomonadaceae bacterium]|nr:DUF1175 family protein [Pyrinomonadaceae bacterium]
MRPSTFITLCLFIFAVIITAACHRSSMDARAKGSSPTPPEIRWNDSDQDGLPDQAEVRSFTDRENFRRWFTSIAELQFYRTSDAWNTEQRDCAGLVRFAWREALRRHDRQWFRKMGAAYEPLAPDVKAYDLEHSPLGEILFRTAPGIFKEAILSDDTFSEFADARTLKEFNCTFISRDRRQAQAGDLIFFYQPWVQKYPYHVMIFLGRPHQSEGGTPENEIDWVVYHTGVSPDSTGTIKKARLATLDQHPDPRWRPLTSNGRFLGFYRLRILE